MNSEPGVKKNTAAKVQAVIDTLGFRRHEGASHLRRGDTTASLGLVLMDVADPFYSAFTRAVEEVARKHRFLVLAGSSDEDAERERNLAFALCARRVDGLIVVPCGTDHAYLKTDLKAGTPIVFADRPAVGLQADAVLVDNAGGTRMAVEHLVAHGHRRIGFLGDSPAIYTARERLRGYTEGLAAIDRRSDEQLVAMGPHTPLSVRTALERFQAGRSPATALMTGNNRITLLVLRALATMSRWHPALVAFDDFELADQLKPAVTVIEQDPRELGQHAAELVFSRLAGDRRPPQRIVLPTHLIARGSGETKP